MQNSLMTLPQIEMFHFLVKLIIDQCFRANENLFPDNEGQKV